MRGKRLYLACNIVKNWSSYLLGVPQPVPVGYVIIGTTFHCNAKCIMCNIHKLYKEKPGLCNNELELPALLEKLKESEVIKKINHIDLTGGEPFIKEHLDDFIIGLFRLPNINLVTINTNGLLPDKIISAVSGILKSLPNGKFFSVSVSMDGIGEVHDRIRGIEGAFDRVEKTLAGLKDLRIEHPDFTIRSNAVIQPENIDHLGELKKYWGENKIAGAFGLIQTPFYTLSRDAGCNSVPFGKDDIQKIKSIGPKSKGADYYLDHNCNRPLHCFAGYASMFIDPFGNVYPCNFLAEREDYQMGSIKADPVDAVWTSRVARDIRAKVKKCPYTGCWNGCEVDQTMIQFEPIERVVKAMTLGMLSYYKMKKLNNFQ
ncbi:MAG: radical SAM protein [Nitrospirae bacterium]|nr:radical SAM protein [Nitrospirota bacterium]